MERGLKKKTQKQKFTTTFSFPTYLHRAVREFFYFFKEGKTGI